jgi:hypothetical protein
MVLVATRASAQTPENEPKAVALFEEGRKFVESGNCPAAIPKLMESLSYQSSIGARLSLAECYEKTDPLAAWRENKEAERLAASRGDDRETYARTKAAALLPWLALVRIELAGSHVDVPGLVVRVDRIPVDSFFYRNGVGFAVAPGPHRLDVSAPRKTTWTQDLQATVGTVAVASVRLEDEHAPEPPRQAQANDGAMQRRVGLVAGAVGLGGIVLGSVAGIVALGKKETLTTRCEQHKGDFPSRCGAGQLSEDERNALTREADTFQAWGTTSTIGFVAGGALLALGVVLYATAPSGAKNVGLRVSPGGAALGGSW